MSGTVANVKMGVCNLTFGGDDIGFTKGFVKLTYAVETTEKTVDQLDTPIDEIATKQSIVVSVPMAEQNFALFSDFVPGATYVEGAGGAEKLILTGASGTSLGALGKVLTLTPVGGTDNDTVTLHKGIPVVNWDVSFDKDNVRVFTVDFKAAPDVSGQWVTFGDPSVPDPV